MMRLSEAANLLQGRLIGLDMVFTSVGTDSRNIAQGQLFVALKGPHFDGHHFAAEAIKQGAAAVLVDNPELGVEPAIVVQDTRLALGQLAAYWRSQFNIPVIAVTGSNGKTTTKEMLTAILSEAAGGTDKVHSTYGNLNNDIGLPLTLLKMNARHQYAVIEMGMNHLGEIEYLTHIAKPNVAVINNAGTAHIGELGSRDNIAKAKGEIFAGLDANGIAVINADDEYAEYWETLNSERKVVTFGLNLGADITTSFKEEDGFSSVNLTTPSGKVSFKLNVQGQHNISNALAAGATAYALGVSNTNIAQGLQSFAGVYGRLERKAGVNGAIVIDDTYNANPDSMKAAIDVLAQQDGEKILVLGDMGELGTDALTMHMEIGTYAKVAGLSTLYCLGELSQAMVNGFGVGKGESTGAKHFNSVEAIVDAILPQMKQGVTVLVKGSRFMKMERVVRLLVNQ